VAVLSEPLRDDAVARLDELIDLANRRPEPALEAQAPILRFGRYVALEEIGSGGEGTTYRGWDPVLRRQVAIKRSSRTCLANVRRTVWEGRHASSIDHPNVIRMFDCVHTESCHALVMEYMAGGDLAGRLGANQRLNRREVYRLGLDIAEALRATHAADLVHGDIKPANILVDADGRYKLADYGASGSGYKELQGWFRGTPGYLPPETYFDRDYSEASDIYGLGVLLYRALTGEPPFSGSSLVELMEASLTQLVPSCRWADPNPKMSWLVESMMAKCPDQRPGLDLVIRVLLACLREPTVDGQAARTGRPVSEEATPMTRSLPLSLLPTPESLAPAPGSGRAC
ncbi:MAG: serine/threonine-protein kinase, partial [Acidobacteriota bacterium]